MSFDKHGLKQLLARALSGDAGAWNDFFVQIRKYLHAEVRKVLGPDASGAVDGSAIVQSTLRRIWEHIGDQFQDGPEDAEVRRFFAWIAKIVRNRIAEELRRPEHRLKAVAGDGIQNVAEPPSRANTVKRDRVAAAVAAALAALPERDQQVVELFWFERLSDAEISRRLGCSVGALRVIRFRALRKLQSPELRTLLEECHDGRY